MRKHLVLSLAAALVAGSAMAQSTAPNATTPGSNAPAVNAPPASPGTNSATGSSNQAVNPSGNAPSSVNASGTATIIPAAQLEQGANSFTEGQAKSRLEGAGLTNVTELKKDDQGIWRGKATRGGRSVTIGFDYKGNIAAE